MTKAALVLKPIYHAIRIADVDRPNLSKVKPAYMRARTDALAASGLTEARNILFTPRATPAACPTRVLLRAVACVLSRRVACLVS